ncbi:uncharacterized protein IL334_000808 [Kwoniella shivajii]|uniref:NmrA-like domain-containing protein n=1 Tax=Kwoniella shivajii TaxID=564305 RepID=A0ABZ1CUG0_9TREE|nr:hypothetical protein IL334_000808 [Kwoniella shivajii]
MVKTILITGATGQQGGAAIRSLVDYNSQHTDNQYQILALTRNPSSDSAKAISTLANVELVQGDLDDAESTAKVFEDQKTKNGIFGIFVVLEALTGKEVEQGKRLVDLAIKYEVKRFVYSGADYSGLAPSPVPHFESKRQIEEYLISTSSGKDLDWTIFRPAGFLENLYMPGYSMVVAALLNPEIKFPYVGTSDIGRAAAEVLVSSNNENTFKGKKIHIAGCSYYLKDFLEILSKFGFPVAGMTKEQVWPMIPDAGKISFDTYNKYGAEGTPEETKQYFPWVKDLEEWLKTEYKPKGAPSVQA